MVEERDLKRASPMVVAVVLLERLGAPSKITTLGLVVFENLSEYSGGASVGQLVGCTMVRFLSFGDV